MHNATWLSHGFVTSRRPLRRATASDRGRWDLCVIACLSRFLSSVLAQGFTMSSTDFKSNSLRNRHLNYNPSLDGSCSRMLRSARQPLPWQRNRPAPLLPPALSTAQFVPPVQAHRCPDPLDAYTRQNVAALCSSFCTEVLSCFPILF